MPIAERLTRRSLLIGASVAITHQALGTVADAMIPTPDSDHPKKTKQPIVLMYHDINFPDPKDPTELDNWVPPKNFLRQLEQVKASGYEASTLSEALRNPADVVALTFDDGLHTAYDFVYPYLQSWGIRATFLVPVEALLSDEDYYIEPEQVKEISDAGHEIGSHSLRHQSLTSMGRGDRLNVLRDSKEYLEDLIGKPVDLFAYPFGAHSAKIAEEVLKVGYKAAFLGKNKPTGLPAPLDRFELPRYHVKGDSDLSGIFARRRSLIPS